VELKTNSMDISGVFAFFVVCLATAPTILPQNNISVKKIFYYSVAVFNIYKPRDPETPNIKS